MRHLRYVFPARRAAAGARAAMGTESTEPTLRDVFRCKGLEEAANDMRRRVQVAMALDLIAAPYAKVLGNHFNPEDFLSASEQLMANSNFVLVLHAGAIWWYHCFLRDHLVARHITRISARSQPDETVVIHLETGPWSRRLLLSPAKAPDAGSGVSLRQMLATGVFQVDREIATVLDDEAFQELCQRDLYPISEELSTDDAAKAAAHIGLHEPAPLVIEDSEGTLNRLEALPPWLKSPLQWHGRWFCRYFGNLSLAMGITSVLVWLPPDFFPALALEQADPTAE